MTGQNDALVTVNWPQAPVSRPEAQLIGSTYQDIEAHADMVITDPTSWVLAGTGLSANQHLPNVVQGEFDRYVPDGVGPANLDVIAHSIVPNRGDNYSDVTWYTVPGGGGVFATGNASWVGALSDSTADPAQRGARRRPRGDRRRCCGSWRTCTRSSGWARPASPGRRRATGAPSTRPGHPRAPHPTRSTPPEHRRARRVGGPERRSVPPQRSSPGRNGLRPGPAKVERCYPDPSRHERRPSLRATRGVARPGHSLSVIGWSSRERPSTSSGSPAGCRPPVRPWPRSGRPGAHGSARRFRPSAAGSRSGRS